MIGVIELPALRKRVFAERGGGAWSQDGDGPLQPAHVSSCAALKDGLYLTSEVTTFVARDALPIHQQLESAAWYARTWGDCYGYYLVATGRAAAMVDAALSIWDAAALPTIMTEAGGTFTDWQGNESIDPGDAVATNGLVLSEVLAITRQAARRRDAD